MHLDRIDDIAIAAAAGETRRTLAGRLFAGGLAALLAAAGFASSDDEAAAAKSCAKKCNKKKDKQKRRKCRKKCERQEEGETFSQQGSATLISQSDDDCATDEGVCVDAVQGTVTGTPIADGIFAGELVGTSFVFEEESFTAAFGGILIATETSTGDHLVVSVDLTLAQVLDSGAFTFEGTYEIDGGSGRVVGATGDGTVTGSGEREANGDGTVDEFLLDGRIILA